MFTYRNAFRALGYLITGFVLFALSTRVYSQPWLDEVPDDSIAKLSFHREVELFEKYWDGRPYERSRGYKPFRRREWLMGPRVDQNGQWDPTAMWRGWEEKQRLFGTNSTDEADWIFMGPSRIPIGSGLGRINCVTFDPTNTNVMWIGSASGGAWKTTNAGLNWEPMTDNLPLLGVSTIVLDYNNPSTVYLATGDCDNSATYSIGVLKSTNGGATWNTTGLAYSVSQGGIIGKLAMSRADPQMLLAATHAGMYRTTNGGLTWALQGATSFYYDLEQDYSNPNIWYATARTLGIVRSTDNGLTWASSSTGLPQTGLGRSAVAVSPGARGSVYVAYSNSSSAFMGLYYSSDQGVTWETRSTSPNLYNGDVNGVGTSGQAWYDLILGVAPWDTSLVFTGGVNIWKSQNGGRSWGMSGHWTGANGYPYVHADQHAIEFRGTETWSGNDGGLFLSTDGGASWGDRSNGIEITQIYRIGVSTLTPNHVIFGTQDNHTNVYRNNQWTRAFGGDGMDCAIEPGNPNVMYGNIQNGQMQRTTNGGASWHDANTGVGTEPRAWVAPFIINPQNVQSLFRATTRIYKSTDRAATWTPITTSFAGNSAFTWLTVAPSDSNVIFCSNGSNSYRSTDGGANWNRLSTAPGSVTCIKVHPTLPNRLWVTCSGYNPNTKVFRSDDFGATWTNLSGGLPNLPVNCVTINHEYPDQVYIGTDVGCYLSQTGGGNWANFSFGLPNVIVDELEIHAGTQTIIAATHGRGLWLSPLEEVGVRDNGRAEMPANIEVSASPNPFNSSTTVKVVLPQRMNLRIALFDGNGREAIQLHDGWLTAGTHHFPINGTGLSSGLYFIRTHGDGKVVATTKALLLK